MTSAITYSTIESNSYNNILSYLNDRTIIVDPRDKGGYAKRPFVYDSDPLAKSMSFGDFPYIVAESPSVEYADVSADGKTKMVTWKMNITVRTLKDGASQGISNTGMSDMLAIADDLHGLFNSLTYRKAFQLLNMFFMNLTKVNSSTTVIDQALLYENNYELEFSTRMEISA